MRNDRWNWGRTTLTLYEYVMFTLLQPDNEWHSHSHWSPVLGTSHDCIWANFEQFLGWRCFRKYFVNFLENYTKFYENWKMAVPFRKVLNWTYRRAHFRTLHNHTLSRKKSRSKNIIFSWRNSIFKMWNLKRISCNSPSINTFSREASYKTKKRHFFA